MSDVISWVHSAPETETRDISVGAVLEAIRTGGKKLRGQITQIRNRFESELAIKGGDLKAAKRAVESLKKSLPAVTWSGKFSQRASEYLVQHSGLFCADLDLLGPELEAVREKFKASPHLLALFLSPTENGLKAVFRVSADASQHAGSFRAVEKHVRELTGLQIDGSGKDVSRLCFMSYDPEIYVNENAIELEPLPEPEKPKPSASRSAEGNSKPSKAEVRDMLAVIPKRPEYHDWIKLVAAVGDALSEDEAAEVLNEWSPEESPNEYAKKLQSGFEKIHVGTLIHLAKEHGWTPDKAKFAQTPPRSQPRNSEPVELPPAPPPYTPPPLTLLPPLLQEYVHAAAKSLNVDVAYPFLPLLSSLGSAIGNTRSIILKRGFIQPPVIWTGVIGPTGSLKSPGLEAGFSPVLEHERELRRHNQQALEQFEEDYSTWKSENPKKRGPEPEKPVILTCLMDDLTIEVLSDRLATNPRGVLVAKDEISHWFASFDQYKNAKGSDVSRWLSLHTAVFLAVDRLKDNRHHRIWMPRVCITGGIQPKILRRVLNEEFFERGLPARFLFAYPKTTQPRWSEETISDELQKRVLNLFENLWLLQPERDEHDQPRPTLLRLDAEAKQIFVRFYNQCGAASVEADEQGAAAWNKLSGYAARLALCGQLARNPNAELVTGDTMKAACELAEWFGREGVRIYASLSETQEQREQRELVDFIDRRGGAVYERDVMQSFTRLKNNKAGTERELTALVQAGRGKWESVPTTEKGGRPARKFRLLWLSTSTQPDDLRGQTRGSVDVDSSNSQENTLVADASGVARL